MKKFLNWMKGEESGQGMVEYGLLIALIALAVILAATFLGGKIADLFNSTGNQL